MEGGRHCARHSGRQVPRFRRRHKAKRGACGAKAGDSITLGAKWETRWETLGNKVPERSWERVGEKMGENMGDTVIGDKWETN